MAHCLSIPSFIAIEAFVRKLDSIKTPWNFHLLPYLLTSFLPCLSSSHVSSGRTALKVSPTLGFSGMASCTIVLVFSISDRKWRHRDVIVGFLSITRSIRGRFVWNFFIRGFQLWRFYCGYFRFTNRCHDNKLRPITPSSSSHVSSGWTVLKVSPTLGFSGMASCTM